MKDNKNYDKESNSFRGINFQQHFRQILAVAGATVTLFATGNIMGYSSVTIPELLSPDSSIKVDHEDLSWIASLVTIGGVVGTLSGGLLSDMFGRKRTIIMSSGIFFLGWMLIGFANSVMSILMGRLLTGMASGLYSASVQVYICEIVDPSIRGVSGSIPTLMVSIGVLAMYIAGSLTHWRTLALASSIFPIFVVFYMSFLPESPTWLLSKGRITAAIQSLAWLKNDEDEAEDEIYRLKHAQDEKRGSSCGISATKKKLLSTTTKFNKKHFVQCCSRFSERSVLQPLGIGLALFFFQKFCGVSAITFYATLIFQYADSMNNYTETIIVGFVRIISNLTGIFLIKFFKRKPLLITSALIMCLSNGFLGVYFFAKDKYGGGSSASFDDIFAGKNIINPSNASSLLLINGTASNLTSEAMSIEPEISMYSYSIECIPLICVTLFMLGSSVGFAVIPWFLVAELLPADVRSLSCSFAYGFCQLCQFTSIKTFLNMLDTFNTYGTFWIYSLIALIGALFVAIFVPETSNMHSSEIEKLFEGSCSSSSDSSSSSSDDDELTLLKDNHPSYNTNNHNAHRKASLIEIIQNSTSYNVVRFEGEVLDSDDDEDENTNHTERTSRFP